jgi:hypothetical protein
MCVFRELEERDAQPSANISILRSLFKVFIQKSIYNNNLGTFFFFTKRGGGREGAYSYILEQCMHTCLYSFYTLYIRILSLRSLL